MTGLRHGLLPFDPERHARFATLETAGFTLPAPAYPIDKTEGIASWGMDGNGPDPSLTVNNGQPVGDCGVCAVPAHADMLTAALTGEDVGANTMSADAVVNLYFTYQAALAGIAWRPPAPGQWTPADVDQAATLDKGVDLGDYLLWLYKAGLVEGFVAIPLSELDAALAFFDVVVVGANMNPGADQQTSDGRPWDVGPGDRPDPSLGHAILYLQAASPAGPYGWCSWGITQPSTAAWRTACPQQAFAVVTRQEAEGKGFTAQYDAIVEALHALGGTGVPTPPAPTPEPSPAPSPAPAVIPPSPRPPAPAQPPKPEAWIAELERLAHEAIGAITATATEAVSKIIDLVRHAGGTTSEGEGQ